MISKQSHWYTKNPIPKLSKCPNCGKSFLLDRRPRLLRFSKLLTNKSNCSFSLMQIRLDQRTTYRVLRNYWNLRGQKRVS